MSGNSNETRSNLRKLEQFNWIDRQTRAIFIEFSVYNPNINLFTHCLILFEIIPSGNLVKTVQFTPMNLFLFRQGLFTLEIIFSLIYLMFIIFIMINELNKILKLRATYFKHSWAYIEWLLVAFTWAAFAMYLNRLYEVEKIMSNLKSSRTEGYFINLQYLTYCNESLNVFIGFCACLGTLKFFKLVTFNRFIGVFVKALRECFKEMANFGLLFLILWLTFNQIMYLIYVDKLRNFSTLVKAFQTSFQIILGKFDFNSMFAASSVLGSAVFIVYNVFIIFIYLSLFLSILIGSFFENRKRVEDCNSDELLSFVLEKVKAKLGLGEKCKKEGQKNELVEVWLAKFYRNIYKFELVS